MIKHHVSTDSMRIVAIIHRAKLETMVNPSLSSQCLLFTRSRTGALSGWGHGVKEFNALK